MGNCCGGSLGESEMNMMQGAMGIPTNKGYAELFDDRVVLGLKGREKLRIIIKIQAMFRGWAVRSKVRKQYGFVARTFAQLGGQNHYSGDPNYNNPRVQEIKAMLGSFEYPAEKTATGPRRRKPLQTLENGA